MFILANKASGIQTLVMDKVALLIKFGWLS